jgi:transcriptional regulator with XRE-family HTH domain
MTPENLRDIRLRLHLTQAQLALLLGVHSVTISDWERSAVQIRPHHEALLKGFLMAVERQPAIGREIRKLIISEGIVYTIYYILKTAFE